MSLPTDSLTAIATEMRNRRINHDKNTSPTLIAWADRIDKQRVAQHELVAAAKEAFAFALCFYCDDGEQVPEAWIRLENALRAFGGAK